MAGPSPNQYQTLARVDIMPYVSTPPTDTERGLPDFAGLDTWSDADILSALVDGQERAVAAVRAAIPAIAGAATAIAL
jgi:N-acetylmuramic acid 6-phosphate (MurNAc-6-P) etherase